jgi:Fe-S cluster biogenesis protein NfuA
MDIAVKENYLKQIELAIDGVRPFLRADGGDVEIVDLDESMKLTLKLIGACKDCSMSAMTMKAGIEEAIIKSVPQVTSVSAV